MHIKTENSSKVLFILIAISFSISAVYYFAYLGPKKQRNQRIKPLIESGISRENANYFDKKIADQSYRWPWERNRPYSEEEILLAKMWLKNPQTTGTLLNYYYLNSSDQRALIWIFGSIQRNISYWENAVNYTVKGDINEDGISNYSSLLGTNSDILNTIKPNPLTKYAYEKGLEKNTIKLIKPLDKNRKLDEWKKWLVNQIHLENIPLSRLKWIVSNFNPNPATIYALKRGTNRRIIDKISDLGNDKILSSWEKYIINNYNSLPISYIKWAKKENVLTKKEKYFASKVDNLPASFIKNVVEKNNEKNEIITYSEKMQIDFLERFNDSFLNKKNPNWIYNSNIDNDPFTNEFEAHSGTFNWKKKNEVYSLLIYGSEIAGYFEKRLKIVENFLKNGLENNSNFKREAFNNYNESRIYSHYSENGTFKNFKNSIQNISEKSGKRDIFLMILVGHGKEGFFKFWENQVSYKNISEELQKIKSKYKILLIESSYSGSAIPYLKGDNRIILTGSQSKKRGEGGTLYFSLFKSMTEKRTDADNNGYCNTLESFLDAKDEIEENYGDEPQISNKKLAQKVYLSEIFVGRIK